MKVLITGAHFTPAQAVIEELLKYQGEGERVKGKVLPRGMSSTSSDKNVEIVYVGRRHTREGDRSLSVESQVLPELGVKFIAITAGRISRYFSIGAIVSLFKIPVGFVQAFFILLREKPDLVVSFGGYVAVPLVFNAWLLNIPIMVHEQTLVSGLANSFSAIFASKIAVSFDQKYSFSADKLIITGNPMRKGILAGFRVQGTGDSEVEKIIERAKKLKKPLILITGGNQGSHSINEVVEEGLDELLKKYVIVHQTGDSKFRDFERLKSSRKSRESSQNYLVMKWISEEDMGRLFSEIDLAVSRCGANTLLELSFHQVPTVMIPLPFVTKDEQTKNARYFAAHGLGKILLQKDLGVHSLVRCIEEMVQDKNVKEDAKRAKKVVILDAEKKLAQEILLLPYKG